MSSISSYQLPLFPAPKRCASCQVVKERSEFYRSRAERDGLQAMCKACQAMRKKQRQRARAEQRACYLKRAEKRCPTCGQIKPAEAFGRDKHSADGLTTYCRDCKNARGRAVRLTPEWREWEQCYNARTREKRRAWIKQWLSEHPGLATEYTRRYRARHPERSRARQAKYVEGHRDKVRAWAKGFRLRHPERTALAMRNCHAKRRGAAGSHTKADLDLIFAAQAGLCASCGVILAKPIHVDHKIPLSRGGSNGPDNLALSCQTCNLQKHAKTDEEYRAWLAARQPTAKDQPA